MISLDEVLQIHNILIDSFGGKKGVRDTALLDSAISRPYVTFDQVELYPTPIDKASAIIESILINHPFSDGNKRTGYVLMRLILLENNLAISANEDEKYDFVISIAKGDFHFEDIKSWLSDRVLQINYR